jgi:hypothetical protein
MTDDPGIRVTVTDLATGEEQIQEIRDDYVVVCAGSCYLAHTQIFPKSGTHQLTIKGRDGGES